MRYLIVGIGGTIAVIGGLMAVASPASAGPQNATAPTRAAAAERGAGTYVSLAPARVLDTRTGSGGITPGARGTVHVAVTGHGGVPSSGVSAVALTVTAVAPRSSGFVTAYADGGSRPATSNLNFSSGRTVANLVIAPVSAAGKVALYNGSTASTPLLADVSGYYTGGTPTLAGSFRSLTPARVLDTRVGSGAKTPKAHATISAKVTAKGGVPASGVSAVIMNVTAVAPTGGGYLTTYAAGQPRPATSSLNFARGQTVSNLVVVAVGTDGKVSLYNGGAGSTPLVGDIAGYFKSGLAADPGTFRLLPKAYAPPQSTPVAQRILDTRHQLGGSRPGPRKVIAVGAHGRSSAPVGDLGGNVSALVMNVTVPDAAANGFVTVGRGTKDGSFTPPNVSNLNFLRGQTVSNLVFAPMNALQDTYFYNGSTGANDLIGDVVGYYISDRGAISGIVTDAATGAPIKGATVFATAYESGAVGSRTTDADGRFEFADLFPLHKLYGSYGLCFSGDDANGGPDGGYVPNCLPSSLDVDGALNADVYAGETTTVDYALKPGVAINGTISAGAADQSRISSELSVFNSAGEEVSGYGTYTSSGGHYRLSGLPDAHLVCIHNAYNLDNVQITYKPQCYNGKAWDGRTKPTDATPLTVSAGHEQSGVDFALEPND